MKTIFPILKYLNVPNSITTLAILVGFCGLLLSFSNQLALAFCCLIFATLLDKLDGLAAKLLNQSSPLGVQLDSLADAINFCLLPAVLIWCLSPSILTFILASLYLVTGIWRLAYFNIHGMEEQGSYFVGVPTTIAASWFAIVYTLMPFVSTSHLFLSLKILLGVTSLLMASKIPYKKNGKLTFSLYLILPTCFIVLINGVL